MSKTDLSGALADAGGGRRRPARPQPIGRANLKPKAETPPSRVATKPITVHFPKEVRSQLKILAVQHDTTLQLLVGEAFNMLFAKYGAPEIAPVKQG